MKRLVFIWYSLIIPIEAGAATRAGRTGLVFVRVANSIFPLLDGTGPRRYNRRCQAASGLPSLAMTTPCKHPKVRVVSRQDDVEFVECLDCGEVFDSDEFRDMEIEEKTGLEPGPASEIEDLELE